MRFLLIIICVSFSFACSALRSDDSIADKTIEEKIHERMWLKIEKPSSPVSPSTLLTYGGVYLSAPMEEIDDYLFSPNLAGYLAVQLDLRMNPVPDGLANLPSLVTLASLTDQHLLLEYFAFLKEAALGYGIRQLVLPATTKMTFEGVQVLRQLQAFDPQYFLAYDQLRFGSVSKKKAFQSLFDHADFWVISKSEMAQVDRMIEKYAKRIKLRAFDLNQPSFLDGASPHLVRKRMSNKMAVQIGRASIVPLQREVDLLPLKEDTLCFITKDPFGVMAEMLRKYTYLITTSDGIANSRAPIVIDNMDVNLADYRSHRRTLIYLGDISVGMKYKDLLDAALLTSTENIMYGYLLPQVLFGVASASGQMPLLETNFAGYSNAPVEKRNILGYASPEMTGLDTDARTQIRSIITEAITTMSTPGCQVAVAVDGSIVLEESYGFLTYDSLIPTDNRTLYDLASVTKVSATLLAVMKLYDLGLIDLDAPLQSYLPQFSGSNKANISLRNVLSHNAGLVSYVPFWERVISEERMEPFYYKTEDDKTYDRRLYGVELTSAIKDSLINWIVQSPVSSEISAKYKYSDIGFMIVHLVVEAIAKQPMEAFLNDHFYHQLGLTKLCFNPRDKGVELFEIAPTEYDYYLRNEQVWGQVHDRNAAVFGGVAGHAGLFSNAHDLLVLMQMLAQNGQYNGTQFLSTATLRYFNNQYFEGNRRGLGWDKRSDIVRNVSSNVSFESFGHTGFTGTVVWVDPQFDLVFIFLSNRVYPDANNYKLIQKDIRTRVQDVVYEAILSKWVN